VGNFGGTAKNHRVKGASTAFWAVVLLGSTLSIAAGFAGGRSVVAADALVTPPAFALPPPVPMQPERFARVLTGAHSLDAADELDPYGDPTLGVAAHPWPENAFDARSERAKIAILVVDGSRAGPELALFTTSPLPFTVVVAPADDDAADASAAARAAGKPVLVDASTAKPSQFEALARDAQGVIASLDAPAARALARVIPRDALVVDAGLREDDRLATVARSFDHHVLWRDVIADARSERPYVDFMLRDALAIAQRHGSAIVLVHARPETFDALKRFADRAQRDGADIVPITALST
jgi:polysaccharide deacetylase 2 family uncharacterized protein YibQ